VEEAEHRIDEVVVEEEALASGREDSRPSLAERQPEAATGLDGGDHADKPFVDSVPLSDLFGSLLLGDRTDVVLVRPPVLLGQSTRVVLDALGLLEDEALQVLEELAVA